MDDHQHQPYRDEGNERHNGDSTRESPPIATMSPSLSRAIAELRHSNYSRSPTTTELSPTPISLEDCNVYTSRILQKIQITRRGLHCITQLCDRLSDNAIRWSSSELLKQIFPVTKRNNNNNNYNSLVQQEEQLLLQLFSLPILEIAMKCVELAVASNTAMVCFFETFLKDLDVVVTTQSEWNWNMHDDDDETTTKERNTGAGAVSTRTKRRSLFHLSTLSQLVQTDRMAMMAVRYTRTLQAIAQSNQRVLDEMEQVVNGCICCGGVKKPPNNGDSPKQKTSGHRVDTIRSAQAELTVLHQRIAVGLVLVAQMVVQWNAIHRREM
ncbi:hypothetical protein IV203_033584 [Nitzschia inconspicua]|uniref:Uncharacterized protein n=1 Tax=Nitzschia inconspicua TaxID=303405 RepID=A0A9K3M2L6_9STRA|nr:hypothetical protein IV203_033584 [Nitzschia inconspicua]